MLLLSSGIKWKAVNGNDIIDLQIADIPGGSRGERFLNKLFTTVEQDFIYSDGLDPWAMWAMKEAVYKAHHRRFCLIRKYDPRSINIHLFQTSGNIIIMEAEYLGYNYWGKGSITADFIHFTATCLPQKSLISEIHYFSSINITNRLIQAVATQLKLDFKYLDIVKDDNNIPQMRYKKFDLSLPFSISHHGKYTALSFQLINY